MPAAAEGAAELELAPGRLAVRGELGFATVVSVLTPGRDALAAAAGNELVLDPAAVTKSDSAGLALLLDWLRAARARNLAVRVEGVPEQLADIARLGGVASLLGLEEGGDGT